MSLELRKAEAEVQAILADRQPLEIERLVSPHHLTVAAHDEFRRSLTTQKNFDEIDEALAMPDPPQKRSDRETSRVLSILDELERGRE